jgi:hypothetical protein
MTTETFNDDAGNRLTQDITYFDQSRSTTGAYNAANELTGLEISYPSASPMTVTFEHNKRGGRTKMTTNPSGQNPTSRGSRGGQLLTSRGSTPDK